VTGLRVSRVHHPVTTLGPGVRAGVWVQGCTIACAGCVSRDTWPATPDSEVPVDAVLDWIGGLDGPLDGLTVSGGEPFQQPEALAELLTGARDRLGPDVDLLVYSGYSLSRLRRDRSRRAALERCDAVVAGPYVRRLNVGQAWQGSSNQQLVPLTDLGRRRYGPGGDRPAGDRPTLQVGIDGDRIWAVGIPRSGDMERLEARLAAAGITFGEVSWRS
jgi:anaerobic ribonucleoside-triphosphate reductase activating protein